MPGGRRRSGRSADSRTERDRRRRRLGQNFLVDGRAIARLLTSADIGPDDLVVEIGVGRGAITEAIADTGAEVWAVEPDPVWIAQTRDRLDRAGLGDRITWLNRPIERTRLPDRPYRVVGNLPYGATTTIMGLLFDRPNRGPDRADLLVQREVADKHAAQPARALRTAAWAPWWTFERGPIIDRRAFDERWMVEFSFWWPDNEPS